MPQRYRTGLLVPLHEEYQYLTDLVQPTKTVRAEGDFYYQLEPPGYDEPVIVQVLEDMGPMRSVVAAEQLISRFEVDIVALVGIAGALDRSLLLGDVVVASEVDYYQYGAKASILAGGSPSIQQAGMHWRASHTVLEVARSFSLRPETRAAYNAWRNLAISRLPAIDDPQIAAFIRSRPIDAIGPIASGDFVGAAAWFRDALLGRNRKLLAIEMEGAGIAAAATERTNPRQFIVARGLSDFADERKPELDRAHEAGTLDAGALRRYALLSAVEYLLQFIPILLEELEALEPAPSESTTVANFASETAWPRPGAVGDKTETIANSGAEQIIIDADADSAFEVELERELARRYHSERSVRRLLDHAEVPWELVPLNDSAINVWYEALKVARDQRKLCALLSLVAKEYPDTTVFVNALSHYNC